MRITCRYSSILACLMAALPMFGADVSSNARQIFDRQLAASEREVMAIVEIMPAKKFDFVPAEGAFTFVRPFGVQARHVAFCLNEVATALLGEPMLHTRIRKGLEI
jgi:hypothetical protein